MSKQWRGLHNPERHNPMTNYAECRHIAGGCGIPCQPDCLCFCCREEEHQIEVEGLRGQTEVMMRIIERDTAAIQRVQALLAYPRDFRGNGSEWNECRDAVLRVLNGVDDE